MEWIAIVQLLMQYGPLIKTVIETGVPIVAELQKANPKLVPILKDVGTKLFPQLKDTIHTVAAAADVLFNPAGEQGTAWIQESLNKLQTDGLDVDGGYGKLTKAAVETFQKAHQPAAGPVDGWAGPLTKKVIESELAKLSAK